MCNRVLTHELLVCVSVQDFTQNCNTLRHVSLLGSPNLTDTAFKCIATNKTLAKIKIESE